MNLKKLCESDALNIAKIEKECFFHPWSEKSIKESLNNDNYAFFGVFLDKELCGYGGVCLIAGECYITNIAVKKKYRRQKIGESILKSIIDFCENSNEFVSLEVRKSNENAINLYKKCGFECVGIRKKFYSEPFEDAIIMTKYFGDNL